MNTSHNCSEDFDSIIKLYNVTYVIAYYVMIPVSAFGFIVNLLTVILPTFYDSFFCKCFCDTIVCLVGITNMNFACIKCILVTEIGSVWSVNSSYEYIFFGTYIEIPAFRTSLLASAYSEIALILNR